MVLISSIVGGVFGGALAGLVIVLVSRIPGLHPVFPAAVPTFYVVAILCAMLIAVRSARQA